MHYLHESSVSANVRVACCGFPIVGAIERETIWISYIEKDRVTLMVGIILLKNLDFQELSLPNTSTTTP